MIDINELRFRYKGSEDILDGISASISPGMFYSIIGQNGCGKTTLLKNIARQLDAKPTSGSIAVDGKNVSGYSRLELSKRVAYVSQREQPVFGFSVYELVLMGRTPYLSRFGKESKKDTEIAGEAMKLANCHHLRDKNCGEISGGELQRVLIARALAQKSNIVLLDEPVSSLDINQQLIIMNSLVKLCEEGRTIVCVLHDINIAARYSDHILLLKDGRLIAAGTPSEVITKENILAAYSIGCEITVNPNTGRPALLHTELA